jgi:hypothetical protein
MKKLLVAFVAVVAVSFASCVNGNTKAETQDSAVAEPVVEEVVEDTAAADTTAAETTAVVAE